MRTRGTRAAAVLVATGTAVMTFDVATYAGTGESLILGKLNTAAEPTTLKHSGVGPALQLESRGNRWPSIRVSSSAKVHHLNADLVDGRDAAALGAHAVTYRGGTARELIPGAAFWELPVASGAYALDLQAIVTPTSGTAQSPVNVVCAVLDLNTLARRFAHVYGADSTVFTGADSPAAMSASASVYVRRTDRPGILCFADASPFVLYQPVKASFTRLNSRERQEAGDFAPSRGAREQLLSSLPR